MPQIIYIKDYDTEVTIPDGADMTQVKAALKKQFPAKTDTTTPQTQPAQKSFLKQATKAAIPTAIQATGPVISTGVKLAGPKTARPALEMGGAAIGGLAGSAAGPAGSFAGEALGYAGGKQAANLLEAKRAGQPYDKTNLNKLPGDIAEGALYAASGRVAAPIIRGGAKLIGKAVKPIIGRLTGAGTGAMEEALKGGEAFKQALRGGISEEDVVSNARNALEKIKETRSADYLKQFEKIGKVKSGELATEINPLRIQEKVSNILPKFVRVSQSGKIDWSRSALGPEGSEGVKKIKQIVDILKNWGSKPGDKSFKGVDMLKRQLDDFYSESSNARAFVTAIKKAVKDVITEKYPQYAKMTKAYSEASSLIKDIESGLMMRKQGMSGRIVADQTLRRLVSAMRDNFPLRKELVKLLGEQGGADIAGQVAGHAMSPILPRGLAGTGPAIVLEGALAHINPAFAGLMALSSPRLMGEFFRLFGKGMKESKLFNLAASKAVSYAGAKLGRKGIDENLSKLDLAKTASAEELPKQKEQQTLSAAKRGIEAYTNNDWNTAIREWQKALKEEPRNSKQIIKWINTAKLEKKKYQELIARQRNREINTAQLQIQ